MYSTLIMFAMTFWTWGQFFKWTGLIYAIYYTILISYEVWKSNRKTAKTEGGETVYEIPHFDTNGSNNFEERKPIKVTLLDMQTIADKLDALVESDNTEKGVNMIIEQPPDRAVFQEPNETNESNRSNQAMVEEYSLSTAEFAHKHQANVGKALSAFN